MTITAYYSAPSGEQKFTAGSDFVLEDDRNAATKPSESEIGKLRSQVYNMQNQINQHLTKEMAKEKNAEKQTQKVSNKEENEEEVDE